MRILVTDGMDKTAMAQLREAGHEVVEQFYEPDQLGAALREFDAVVVRSKTKVRANHIDEAKGGKLKLIIRGGVGVSGLEMSQNSERLVWTAEEVDAQLHKMMKNIHKVSAEAAEEYGLGYDLVAGANIAGFKKVAQAMYEQGVF